MTVLNCALFNYPDYVTIVATSASSVARLSLFSNMTKDDGLLKKISEMKTRLFSKRDLTFATWAEDWRDKNKHAAIKQYKDFVYMYDKAVEQLLKTRLSSLQTEAIIRYLSDVYSVNTWETVPETEKWLVIAGVALAKALSREKVDIIIQDIKELATTLGASSVQHTLPKLFQMFDVSVSVNNSDNITNLRHSYSSQVVVGCMDHFKEHYVMQCAGLLNVRGDRSFDCVLLNDTAARHQTRLSDVTACSYNIPGMAEMLEEVYVFISKTLSAFPASAFDDSVVSIASKTEEAVLSELFAIISKEEIRRLDSKLADDAVTNIWNSLIMKSVIDDNGKVLVTNFKVLEKMLQQSLETEKLKVRIQYLLRIKLDRERRLNVPPHFWPTIEKNLKSWIKDAIHARRLQPSLDYDYIRDPASNGMLPKLDATLLTKTRSLETALVQFLELKGGSKPLSPQFFCSIFITNNSYLELYKNVKSTDPPNNRIMQIALSKEKCLNRVLDQADALNKWCKERKVSDDINRVMWLAILDQWTLWFEATEQEFDRYEPQRMQVKLSNLLSTLKLGDDDYAAFKWMLPHRMMQIAKILMKQPNQSSRFKAVQLFDEVITSTDNLLLQSAAHYYKAFTIGHVDLVVNQKAMIESLAASEKCLIRYVMKVKTRLNTVAAAYRDDRHFFRGSRYAFYDEAKRAEIEALQVHLKSIRAVVGKSVSAEGLSISGVTESKCVAIFESLLRDGFVTGYTINKQMLDNGVVITEAAKSYAMDSTELERLLKKFEEQPSEKALLETTKQITKSAKSRRLFWRTLSLNDALTNKRKALLITKDWYLKLGIPDGTRKKLDQVLVSPSDKGVKKLIIRDHSVRLADQIERGTTLLFDRSEFKKTLNDNNYFALLKKHFISTDIAFGIDRAKLEAIDFTAVEPNMAICTLDQAGIPIEDRHAVWNELIRQGVIEVDGSLKSMDYRAFTFAECPIYDEPIKTVIDEAFTLETTRRQWLEVSDGDTLTADRRQRLLSSISRLPTQVHRQLAADWADSGLIRLPGVARSLLIRPHASESKAKGQLARMSAIEQIVPDRDDRIKVLSYLKASKCFFVDAKRTRLHLEAISSPNPSTVTTFMKDCSVFDDVIVLTEREKQFVMRATLQTHHLKQIIAASNAIQEAVTHEWTCQYLSDLALELAADDVSEPDVYINVTLKKGRMCPLDGSTLLLKLFKAAVNA